MKGAFLIGLAAMLWATDTPFRFPLLARIDPTVIVFYEHLIATLTLLPWVYFRFRKSSFKMRPRDWALSALIGAGGSALATILFTASFRHVNPSVAILLQKMQPVFVVLIAHWFLGETPKRSFYAWAALAMASAAVLSAPNFHLEIRNVQVSTQGALYALGAAALWAMSTVAGKTLLTNVPSTHVTFWRFVFGLLALSLILALSGTSFIPGHAQLPRDAYSLLYMAWVPGLFAMASYYFGLKRTPASVATFVELLYPVSAVLLNTWILRAPLSLTQIGAGALLLLAVFQVGARN